VQPENATARADGNAYRAVFDADLHVVKGDTKLGELIPEPMYVGVTTTVDHEGGGDTVLEEWVGTDAKADPPTEYFRAHAETSTSGATLVTKVKVSHKP